MKIPHIKIIRSTMPFCVFFLLFACSKDTDLLADYVVADIQEAKFLSGIVLDDYFVSTTNTPMTLDVLSNDGFENPENVKIVEITTPSNGNVVVNEDKTLTYTPGGDPSETIIENPSTSDSDTETVIETPKADEVETEQNSQSEEELETNTETVPQEEAISEEPKNDVNTQSSENTESETATQGEVEPETQSNEPKAQESETQTENETTDTFTYTTETTNEDSTTTTQTGTVTVVTNRNYGELKAFPSAYGGGSQATGARAAGINATVYHVTNLNDSGSGSLRAASSLSNVFIVFDVSGTIVNRSTLRFTGDNVTIAGQTAPEGGITIAGKRVDFVTNDNIIVRYLTFRPDLNPLEFDAVAIGRATNSVYDHLSVSWGTDEIFSFEVYAINITMQRILMAEGNKTGSIVGDDGHRAVNDGLSVHQNLWYNISHRFPNVSTDNRADIINNVVYNWSYRLTRTQGSPQLNHINNYYLRQKNGLYDIRMQKVDYRYGGDIPQIHTSGNLVLPNVLTNANADNWPIWSTFGTWSYGGTNYELSNSSPVPLAFKKSSRHSPLGNPLPIKTARDAFDDVTNDVGNNKRIDGSGKVIRQVDEIDEIYLTNVINDNPVDYGEFKDFRSIKNSSHYVSFQNKKTSVPVNEHPSNYDSDKDGMPDIWEKARGLNPAIKDHNGDADGNGYTNIEEYINLVDF